MFKRKVKKTTISVGKRYFQIASLNRALSVRIYHILGHWLLKKADMDRLKTEVGHMPVVYRPSGRSAFQALRFAIADICYYLFSRERRADFLRAVRVRYANRLDRKQLSRHSRLPDEVITALMKWSEENDFVERVYSKELLIQDQDLERDNSETYFKQKGTKLLRSVLDTDPDGTSYRTVANIGGRIDATFYYLAKRFPNTKFVSIDFQPNLDKQNEAAFGTLPENWRFLSGYAMDLFQRGLKVDVVFMMATSVLFTYSELCDYIRYFHKNGVKKIVLNESWYPRTDLWRFWKVSRPEELRPGKSYVFGYINNYHNNYIAAMEDNGYDISLSEIKEDHRDGDYYVYNLVATRKDLVMDKRLSKSKAA